jgi:hypothetical protein
VTSSPEDLQKSLDHAWRYFELHANQRMAVFNFFLVLSGLVSAGLASAIQGSVRFSILGVVLGLLLSLVSFIFWKLDQRVCFLIGHAERNLAKLESMIPNFPVPLFYQEPGLTNVAKSTGSRWARLWTYGLSFRVTFVIIGVFGFCGSLLSILRFNGVVSW